MEQWQLIFCLQVRWAQTYTSDFRKRLCTSLFEARYMVLKHVPNIYLSYTSPYTCSLNHWRYMYRYMFGT